ncbi:MAG: tRNA dihydrouridine(20/20a) synthase DusA [Rhodobiaceae bacterium]|nr:tRNA dihydrouridine(20/20a) synthase DusA [Rhodobiaceae bacterium]
MSNSQLIRVSVAPMMEWTDRHCRVLHRLIAPSALLYTEMVAADAVRFGDRERLIGYDAAEHPVALQLGGSEPEHLAEAARIGADRGYDEINLNVGCPSDRVQAGRFGACLMAEPDLVARCVAAMKRAVDIPVTVKCRIGVDEQDPEEALPRFARAVIDAGVDGLAVHARKAWLKGLSPKENRSVPPLDYDIVYRLKRANPEIPMAINGGIETCEAALGHLEVMDQVMIGRAAYHDPWLLHDLETALGGHSEHATRHAVVAAYLPYVERGLCEGIRLNAMTRHMLGLYAGLPGARRWRRILTEEAIRPGAGIDVIERALDAVEPVRQAA